MELAVGTVIEGKVTGITKFGAFVALPENKSGMVHISEISTTYVNDIREHLKEGQSVLVKIIAIDDQGRLNLSIKKAQPPQQRQAAPSSQHTPQAFDKRRPPREALTFEDKLKQFLQDSESKMSDLKHSNERKGGSSRRARSR
jgi:S1 RNA binding domain protein